MKNKRFFGFVFALAILRLYPLAVSAEFAPPQPPLIEPEMALELSRSATADAYPDADSVLVADHSRVVYRPDGTSVVWNEEYSKVLTEKGRRGARTRTYGYMTQYGRLRIVTAEIIRPDGERVVVDIEKNSREMVEPSQMSANIYDPNYKALTLTIAGIEPGDLIHLITVRTTTKARVPDTWSDYSVFEYTSPILYAKYEVHAPDALPLETIRLRDELPDSVRYSAEKDAEGTWHRWQVRDVPQAFSEPNMPPLHTVVQRLLVSTVSDWREISRWYWRLSEPRLAAVNDAMKAEVERRVEGAATRDERLRRIFDFVSQDIRYMGITPEEEAPGYEPHDVCMTFDNRYGVCRDKAALLVAMLRMADITAYPVLIHAGAKMDPEVPLPFFNHAIVAAEREGSEGLAGADRYILMDPTDENTRDLLPGYLRNRSFLVAHPEGETLLDSGPGDAEEHLVRIKTRGALDSNMRLTAETRIVFEGVNDNIYRGHFSKLKPEERRRFFEGLVRARVAGATLTDFSIEPENLRDTGSPLVVTVGSVAPDYVTEGDEACIVDLPWMGGALGFANRVIGRTGLEKRRFPLRADPVCGVEEDIEIELGENFAAPLSLPGGDEVKSAGLSFHREAWFTNGVLRGASRFLVLAAEFSPREYAQLREDRRIMEYAGRRRPLFPAPLGADEADSLVLSRRTSIELESASSWTSTTVTRRRILTYAGKKSNAELKINFNPVWQTAEVLQARVIAPDGSVQEAAEPERNLMDASWVAGAPRYPAGRTLVVNLPGVEVGSVVETTVKVSNRGFPFFSLRDSLRGYEPCEELVLELSHPKGVDMRVAQPRSTASLPVGYESVETEGGFLHRWTMSGVPALRREDSLPPRWSFLPTVIASTGEWGEYAGELAGAMSALAESQPAAAEKARELSGESASDMERVRAIRDFVARNIRAAGPSFTSLPFSSLSAADTTLRDGYGNGADQAILLLSMLRAAGIKAELVFVAGGSPVLPELLEPLLETPQRGLYGNALVRVELEGGEIVWLNDTDQYAEPGTTPHERRAALTSAGEHFFVEVSGSMESRSDDEWRIELDEEGTARIEIVSRKHGVHVNSFRRDYAEMTPEMRSRNYQEMVAGVSQAAVALGELETDLDSYPGVMRFAVEAERYAVRDGNTLQLEIPGLGGNVLGLRSEKRVSPLYLGPQQLSEFRCVVNLPAAAKRVLLAPPADGELELPGGFGVVSIKTRTSRLADGRLELAIERTLDLRSAVAAEMLYPAILAINRQLQHPRLRTLVVELESE